MLASFNFSFPPALTALSPCHGRRDAVEVAEDYLAIGRSVKRKMSQANVGDTRTIFGGPESRNDSHEVGGLIWLYLNFRLLPFAIKSIAHTNHSASLACSRDSGSSRSRALSVGPG